MNISEALDTLPKYTSKIIEYLLEQDRDCQVYYLTTLVDPISPLNKGEFDNWELNVKHRAMTYLSIAFCRDVEEMERCNGVLGVPEKYQQLRRDLIPLLSVIYPMGNLKAK